MRPALLMAVLLVLVAAAPAGAQEVAYQQDAGHSGQASVPGLDPPFRRRWVASIGRDTSYPVIAGGRVFVTAGNSPMEPYGSRVIALSTADGRVLWERPLVHTYFWSGLAYAHDTVFVLTYDGELLALDPASGAVRWAKDMPGDSASSEPTPAGDSLFVFVDGALTKVDPASGAVRWSAPVPCCGTGHTSPTVADGRVFVGQACGVTHAFDVATGDGLWTRTTGCSGGGGKTVGYWGGRVYVREAYHTPEILDATSGAPVAGWAGGLQPAFSGDTGFFGTAGGDLIAATVPGLQPRWRHPDLLAPPLIVNGRVVTGTAHGMVALDAGDGRELWRDADVLAATPDEHNVAGPVAGLGAGDGIFAVPTESGLLVAYEHGSGPGAAVPGAGTPTVPGAPPPAGGTAPALSIRLKRRWVFIGRRTRVLGRLSGAGALGARRIRLEIDEHPYDGDWRVVARRRTLADGTFAFRAGPRRNTMLRAVLGDDRSVVSPPQELFAEYPFRWREHRRSGKVTVTIYAPRRATLRRRPLFAYVGIGRTAPWRRVDRGRWQVRRSGFVRASLRVGRRTLRRSDAHWVICVAEPVPDGVGRPFEFERRCGERTLPRGIR